MATEIKELVIIQASAKDVWDTLLDTARWWPQVKLDPLSGSVSEGVQIDGGIQTKMRGMIVGYIPGERVRLSWKEDAWPGRTGVVLDIVPQGDHETRAEICHYGWGVIAEAERQHVIDVYVKVWRHHLGRLKAVAEG